MAEDKEVIEALLAARSALRDLDNGWPEDELAEPIEETLARIDKELAKFGVAVSTLEDDDAVE